MNTTNKPPHWIKRIPKGNLTKKKNCFYCKKHKSTQTLLSPDYYSNLCNDCGRSLTKEFFKLT